QAENGAELSPEGTWDGLPSVAFDAVFVPGGAASSQAIGADGRGLHYLLEAYKHLKPVAFAGDAQALASQLSLPGDPGVVLGATATDVFPGLRQALMQHRIWQREAATKAIPA
ncbi:catalase HPII, partial [Pseudomonas aeruginosa]|nr:catalase HPII [Pseudomonas aeruginosa]